MGFISSWIENLKSTEEMFLLVLKEFLKSFLDHLLSFVFALFDFVFTILMVIQIPKLYSEIQSGTTPLKEFLEAIVLIFFVGYTLIFILRISKSYLPKKQEII